MSIDHRLQRRAIAVAFFVTLLWSSSWVLIRIGLDDESLPPLGFAALRYGVAAAVLLAAVGISPKHRVVVARLDGRAWLSIVGLGVVFYTFTQGAQFVAIDNQPAATTSLVLSLTPLMVALAAGRAIAEKSTRRQVVGGAAVAAGALAYFGGDLGGTRVGMIAALVALAANAVSALLGRHVNRDPETSPLVVTALSMAVGVAVLVPVGLISEGMPSVSGRATALIIWLAVVNTALAFTLWNLALQHLSAVASAAINNTMLIQIAVLAWIFLSEPIGVLEGVGIVLVTIGVLLSQTRTTRVPSRRASGDRQ